MGAGQVCGSAAPVSEAVGAQGPPLTLQSQPAAGVNGTAAVVGFFFKGLDASRLSAPRPPSSHQQVHVPPRARVQPPREVSLQHVHQVRHLCVRTRVGGQGQSLGATCKPA